MLIYSAGQGLNKRSLNGMATSSREIAGNRQLITFFLKAVRFKRLLEIQKKEYNLNFDDKKDRIIILNCLIN